MRSFKLQNKVKNESAFFGWLNLRESCNLRFDEWVKGHSWQKVTRGNMLSPEQKDWHQVFMLINGQVRNSIKKQNHLLGAMKKESKKHKKCLKKKR